MSLICGKNNVAVERQQAYVLTGVNAMRKTARDAEDCSRR